MKINLTKGQMRDVSVRDNLIVNDEKWEYVCQDGDGSMKKMNMEDIFLIFIKDQVITNIFV